MNIWQQCQGESWIKSLELKPWRVVEAQHILSARDLVDSSEEHDILETLIERSKPKMILQKDYLIDTPFRYPPLPYGSRFATRFEPALWYGSLELKTALSEVAYYIKKFHLDTEANFSYIHTFHTAFNVYIQTTQGVDLTSPPFADYQSLISHPTQYQDSQTLGQAMRQAEIKGFLYHSARCHEKLTNFAAFEPSIFKPFKHHYSFNQQTWQCIANRDSVEFSRMCMNEKITMIFNHETC